MVDWPAIKVLSPACVIYSHQQLRSSANIVIFHEILVYRFYKLEKGDPKNHGSWNNPGAVYFSNLSSLQINKARSPCLMYFSHSPILHHVFSCFPMFFPILKRGIPKDEWDGFRPSSNPAPRLNVQLSPAAGTPPWRPFRKFVSIWHPCPALSGFWYSCTFCGPGLVPGARAGWWAPIAAEVLSRSSAEVRLLALGMFWRVPFPAFDIGGVWMSRVSRKWVKIMLRKLRFAYLFGGW